MKNLRIDTLLIYKIYACLFDHRYHVLVSYVETSLISLTSEKLCAQS